MNIEKTFNPALHGLRGVAAMAVVFFHWAQFYPAIPNKLDFEFLGQNWDFSLWFDMGGFGVALFFVLSGYLLGGQLSQKALTKESITRFWQRRLLRIYPAFWFQLAILLVIGIFIGSYHLNTWGDGIRHILLWVNMPPWMMPPLNNVWWTLPLELSFYLFLPLLIFIQRKIGIIKTILFCFLVTIAWRVLIMQLYEGSYFVTVLPILDALPGSLATFSAGMAIVFVPKIDPRFKKILLVLSIIAFYILAKIIDANVDSYWTGHWLLIVFNPVMAIVLATILYTVLSPFCGIRFLSSKAFIWLGEVSFGIYLWHYPILQFMQKFWPELQRDPLQNIGALIICLTATFAIAHFSFRCIEQPIMHWKHRG